MPIWTINFGPWFLRLPVLPRWRERPQTAMFFGMVGEVEMSRNWFVSVFIVLKNLTQSAVRFADVYFVI